MAETSPTYENATRQNSEAASVESKAPESPKCPLNMWSIASVIIGLFIAIGVAIVTIGVLYGHHSSTDGKIHDIAKKLFSA